MKLNGFIPYLKICRVILFSALIGTSCSTLNSQECIDPSKVSDDPCTMEYNPVCGCDQETYGNPCQAQRSGVKSWESGACNNNL